MTLKQTLLGGAVCVAVALGGIGADGTFSPIAATVAQAQEAPVPEKPKTQKVQSMTKPTFDALTEAQKMIESKSYVEAKAALDKAMALGDKLNEYEKATIFQTYAYLYAEQENYQLAVENFKKSIDISNPAEGKGLPYAQVVSTMYNLGQLYMVIEQYPQAIAQLEAWRKVAESVNGQGLAMLATAYFQNENFDKAVPLILEAIKMTPDPKEQWYQLLLAMYLEKEDFAKGAETLEIMVPKWPGNKTYWIQLAAIYNELGKEKESFAMFAAAYEQGFLEDDKDLVRMARLYMYHENPIKGALVMEKGIKAGKIQRTSENLEVVSNAYFNAREYKKAIPWLKEAADKASTGILELRLCQAQMQEDLYKEAEEACKRAIDKKGLKDEGAAWVTMAIVQIEQKKWGAATTSLNNAKKFPDHVKDADQWLAYVRQKNTEANIAAN